MLGLIDIGRIAVSELHSENTHTPNVDTCLVPSLSLDQFRSHPADSSNLARSGISLLSQLGGISEICKLHLAFNIDKDVVTLDVSVDYMSLVKIVETQKGLAKHIGTAILRVGGVHLGNDRSQSVVHDFHKDPQAASVLIGIKHFQHDLIALAHVHQTNFVVHQLDFTLILKILDKFEGYHLAI